MKKVALRNLGCKVNAYETEAMQEMLENKGYEIVPFDEGADIYIVNTCTVTNIADRKSRQMLHKAKKLNPKAIVVAAGCYVQANEKVDESIDVVIGNNKKKNIAEILEEYMHGNAQEEVYKDCIDINKTREYESLELTKSAGHTRAFLKIQDGCNLFCTYCIIPFARGRSRSRDIKSIKEEVIRLAGNGYKEIVLTGIHISSYGIDFAEEGEAKNHLLSLLTEIHDIEGIERIRLSSLEPRIIKEEFVKELKKLRKICPHFHLSLQSGCNATLERMRRRYTAEEYKESCSILRKYYEEPAITTDIIVGFPGETLEEFAQTEAFVEEIGFYETHLFKYSRREGTKAAQMENQIPEREKARRSEVLKKIHSRKQKEYEEKQIGKEIEILVEEVKKKDGKAYAVGYTPQYIKVEFETEEDLENQIIKKVLKKSLQIIH